MKDERTKQVCLFVTCSIKPQCICVGDDTHDRHILEPLVEPMIPESWKTGEFPQMQRKSMVCAGSLFSLTASNPIKNQKGFGM
ncbi:hypothetical protein UP17_18100 [Peribacillus simplex]|nr:hypothetical protein UP17_18100 [Peribacillus simplex]